MKNRTTDKNIKEFISQNKNADVFDLMPALTEEETINFLSKTAENAYSNTNKRVKFLKPVLIAGLFVIAAVCRISIYLGIYDFRICCVIIMAVLIYIYSETIKNLKLQLLCGLFVDNANLKIIPCDYADAGVCINTCDSSTIMLQGMRSAFLISDYIMSVFKDNNAIILKIAKGSKDKVLDYLYKNNTLIMSYDKTPANFSWSMKYFRKLSVRFIAAISVFAITYIYMCLS